MTRKNNIGKSLNLAKTNYTIMRLRDYKTILKFYKIDTTTMTNKEIKEKAEHFLAVKLCRCIKHIRGPINPDNEKRAISICYNSVIKKKHMKIFNFECKKSSKLLKKKGTRKIFIEKLRKNKSRS
jgi:hypothetical protein